MCLEVEERIHDMDSELTFMPQIASNDMNKLFLKINIQGHITLGSVYCSVKQ